MQASHAPAVSIVVPTRNRPDLLKACLAGVLASAAHCNLEVIVVDDGSDPPLLAQDIVPAELGTVLRLPGAGPAAARNAGARIARGSVLLFTDDDTVPAPTWAAAAVEYLEAHPDAVGVSGPIRSVPWDPLYEQSLEAPGPGHHWTCNMAYRRSVFEAIGGFRADLFSFAHAEDRDLATRAAAKGALGFAEAMEVRHTPRTVGIRDVARETRWVRDDLILYALHPELTDAFTLPVKLALVVGAARRWHQYYLTGARSPRRIGRAALFAVVGAVGTAWTVVRTPAAPNLRNRDGRSDA